MEDSKLVPGLILGQSWSEYRAIKLPSPSLLKHGMRSMRRLKRVIDGKVKGPSSSTVAVGQCVHCLVAGEMDRIAVMPRFENDADNLTATGKRSSAKTTGYYKESVAKWSADHVGKQILTEKQMADAKFARSQIERNAEAKKLIDRSSLEVTVIGEIEGVLVKTRMDGIDQGRMVGWDLKTCPDIEPQRFYRHCKQLGYFFQFAFHRLALRSCGIEIDSYQIIAQEIGEDFDTCVIDVPFALLEVWQDRVIDVVKKYQRAIDSDRWPGIYPTGKAELQVPNWDMASDDDIDFGELVDNDDQTEVYF